MGKSGSLRACLNKKSVCVCILAYNEERHIENTIRAILRGNHGVDFDIVVYANGCTDHTAEIVRHLGAEIPNLYLRELSKPSKPLAWNRAFAENPNAILVFSDGDVEPHPGSVFILYQTLLRNPALSLACCQFWPCIKGGSFEQKIVGFLQIPLVQDFLSGQFYAIRRVDYLGRFQMLGFSSGLPDGIVAEDTFIERIVPRDRFFVVDHKVCYEPPVFSDYCKYLARIRWQEEQLLAFYPEICRPGDAEKQTLKTSFLKKLSRFSGVRRLLLGIFSASIRWFVKLLCRSRINQYYKGLCSVDKQGSSVLSELTRSRSVK